MSLRLPMQKKIFLKKYRVSFVENEAPTELPDGPAVYKGEEIGGDKRVVVEAFPARALTAAVREQRQEEARAAMKLRHPNIRALYDFGVEDDQLIYVSEYLDGTSTEEWVNSHGQLPTDVVVRIALQVMSALSAASVHRLVHHAINPSNLLLGPGKTTEDDWPLVKVLHLVSVAPAFSVTNASSATSAKSSPYASPEQRQHGRVDFRSEMYSLGGTMWFLLTGALPLLSPQGLDAMPQTSTGLAVDRLSGMPARVTRLLGEMLSVSPEARPADPLALYRQLQDCLGQVEQREPMARKLQGSILSTTPTTTLTRRRVPVKTLALAAVLLAIAVLSAVLLPEYLRHNRIRNAQKPIGVPIGVPETPSGPVVTVSGDTAAPPIETPSNAPVASSGNDETVDINTTQEVASHDQFPETPAQPPPIETPSTTPATSSGDNETADINTTQEIASHDQLPETSAQLLPIQTPSTITYLINAKQACHPERNRGIPWRYVEVRPGDGKPGLADYVTASPPLRSAQNDSAIYEIGSSPATSSGDNETVDINTPHVVASHDQLPETLAQPVDGPIVQILSTPRPSPADVATTDQVTEKSVEQVVRTIVAHEVRRALPPPPEVRRAEPAPPEEEPDVVPSKPGDEKTAAVTEASRSKRASVRRVRVAEDAGELKRPLPAPVP